MSPKLQSENEMLKQCQHCTSSDTPGSHNSLISGAAGRQWVMRLRLDNRKSAGAGNENIDMSDSALSSQNQ